MSLSPRLVGYQERSAPAGPRGTCLISFTRSRARRLPLAVRMATVPSSSGSSRHSALSLSAVGPYAPGGRRRVVRLFSASQKG